MSLVEQKNIEGGGWQNYLIGLAIAATAEIINDFGCFVDGLKGKAPSHKH